jgi:hypothetical protein
MREEIQGVDTRADIAKKKVVYQMARTDAVVVRRDVPYGVVETGDNQTLTMDVYYPPEWKHGACTPAVLFVTGYPDAGVERRFGCAAKEMEMYVSWGGLVAASGLVGITYTARQPDSDVHAVLRHVREHAASLGIDARRVGIWSCSGNAPNALSLLIREYQEGRTDLRCAVLCYAYMLDLDGATHVADAASVFRFVNPAATTAAAAGRSTVSIADLPRDVPLFIARAGLDEMPHLNDAIDNFVLHALRANLPVTVANHHTGPHAFDILDESAASRDIIARILAFMRFYLLSA